MKDILCLLINITQYEIVLHKYMHLHLLHRYSLRVKNKGEVLSWEEQGVAFPLMH